MCRLGEEILELGFVQVECKVPFKQLKRIVK